MEKSETNQDLPPWFELIQTSRMDFIYIYEKIQQRRYPVVISWPCIFLPELYMPYRKLFGATFLYYAFIYLLLNLREIYPEMQIPIIVLGILVRFLIVAFGFNQYYFKKLERLYEKGKRKENYQDNSNLAVILILAFQLFFEPIMRAYFKLNL